MRPSSLPLASILIFLIARCKSDLVKNIVITENLLDPKYDVVIFINDNLDVQTEYPLIVSVCKQYHGVDANVGKKLQIIPFLSAPGKSLIFSPTGSLTSDTSDSRLLNNAARAAIELMHSIGKRKPLIVVGPFTSAKASGHKWLQDPHPTMTCMLGALQGLYTPLTIRQTKKTSKYDYIGVLKTTQNAANIAQIVNIVKAVEEGRMIARDICGTDQEKMTALKVVDYISEHFANSGLLINSMEVTKEKWPTIAAVNRNNVGTIYDGRVITMEYTKNGEASEKELYLVGKGIILDTGGLSLKTGGSMNFMHNDKCGAAGVTGFMKVVSLLEPKKINVHAKLAYIRNNIGSDAYAVDEIIPSKEGIRSLIGSTDAEGRNVMVDLLVDSILDIMGSTDKHFFKSHFMTIATLTGHVGMAFGNMPAALDNGPARLSREAYKLRDSGALIGDLTEVSTLRREDYENCYPVTEYEDLQQRNTHPDTVVNRGHQYPAAWMIMASGLNWYSLSQKNIRRRIKYTHLDVASAVGVTDYKMPTGTPVPMLFANFILPELFPKS